MHQTIDHTTPKALIQIRRARATTQAFWNWSPMSSNANTPAGKKQISVPILVCDVVLVHLLVFFHYAIQYRRIQRTYIHPYQHMHTNSVNRNIFKHWKHNTTKSYNKPRKMRTPVLSQWLNEPSGQVPP